MNDKEERKSFLGRQWEAYKLVDETVRNKSLLKDFVASDPANGPIVKATQDTRGKAHFGTGVIIFGALCVYGWRGRRRFANDDAIKLVALFTIPPLAARLAVDVCISSYLLREKDRRAAYVKFSEWLQMRA